MTIRTTHSVHCDYPGCPGWQPGRSLPVGWLGRDKEHYCGIHTCVVLRQPLPVELPLGES